MWKAISVFLHWTLNKNYILFESIELQWHNLQSHKHSHKPCRVTGTITAIEQRHAESKTERFRKTGNACAAKRILEILERVWASVELYLVDIDNRIRWAWNLLSGFLPMPRGDRRSETLDGSVFFSWWSSALERLAVDLNRNRWSCQWQWARTGNGVIILMSIRDACRELYQLGRELHQQAKCTHYTKEKIENLMRAMACTYYRHGIPPRNFSGAIGGGAIGGGWVNTQELAQRCPKMQCTSVKMQCCDARCHRAST